MTIAWLLAIIITLGAAYYQRVTGPTYPKKAKFKLIEEEYEMKLPRSAESGKKCRIILFTENRPLVGKVVYKRFNVDEPYDTIPMHWYMEGRLDEPVKQVLHRIFGGRPLEYYPHEALVGELPKQPPAGKLQYYFLFKENDKTMTIAQDNPVVVRYKGKVPSWILILHVVFIFIAMLTSTLTGILALMKHRKFRFYMWFTLVLVLIGGLVFGPIVQKFAFGAYWTGVPFGWDLTDNKLLIGFLAWLAAALLNIKRNRMRYAFAAALVMLVVFSIPHSMYGSELDYKTGKVTTGK